MIPKFCTKYYTNVRTRRLYIVPKVHSKPSKLSTSYILVSAAEAAESLPQILRNLHKVEMGVFRKELDILFSTVAHEPIARHQV